MKILKHGNSRSMMVALLGFALVSVPAIAKADPAGALAEQTSSNTVTVKSTVVDETGEPLIGATVMVKGTTNGAATDIDGNFSITCAPTATLVVSYVGYTSLEVKASEVGPKITLSQSNEVLDEVIVIGYGTTTRKSATGSVDQVKGDKLKDFPVQSMTQAMQGVAPNVVIQNKSWDPNNQNTTFNIRGVSTTSSNDPLFVIDGIVADNGAFNRLNPNDVENISILKDAGAAAIYGSRSANGVVLVTTKQGKKDQPAQVTFSANVGWENPKTLFHAVDGYQNAILWNMANVNAGKAAVFTPAQIQDLYNHRSEEVWALDEIFQTSLQQKYNAQVSGGSGNTTYMFSLGYFDQGSNFKGHNNKGLQRYNMRMNIATDIKRLHIAANMSFTRSDSQTSSAYLSNVYADSKRMPAYYYYNLIDEHGHYRTQNTDYGRGHPLAYLDGPGYNKYRNNDWDGRLSADLKIIDGLKLVALSVSMCMVRTGIPPTYVSNTTTRMII